MMLLMIEFLRQLALAFLGTVCFGLLFHVPPRHFAACGIVGAIGWLVYWAMMLVQPSSVLASLVAVIPLTIATRAFAIVRRALFTSEEFSNEQILLCISYI